MEGGTSILYLLEPVEFLWGPIKKRRVGQRRGVGEQWKEKDIIDASNEGRGGHFATGKRGGATLFER